MILIGSQAIRHWYPDFPREPKDYDYIIKVGEGKVRTLNAEYHINTVLENYPLEVLDADTLCTLKASHLCWDINWEKHMWDLQFLLNKGCTINQDLFWKLYNYWNTVHIKNKRSDLKMSKEEFFTNAINYDTLEHDEVHKLLNPIPVYTRVLKDNKEVELDENKFNDLSFEDKCNFVREEVMVMAYERYKSLGFQRAYNRMLKKFIISHIPLFALSFVLENYVLLSKCKLNFIEIIDKQLELVK